MKIKNKRTVILTTIFGILLLSWWLTTPIETITYSGSIPIKHSIIKPNYRDPILDIIDLDKWNDDDIVRQTYANTDVRYSLNNIGTPITVKRYLHSKDVYYNSSWIWVLLTIGHYDEAIDYLNDLDYNSRDVRTALNNNNCYSNPYGEYTNRFKIMTCAAKNNIDLLLNGKKYIAENEEILSELKVSVDSDRNYMEDVVNGVGKKGKAIVHKPLPVCETNRDRKNIKPFPAEKKDEKFQFCGALPSVIYYLQHGQFDEANEYLNRYKPELSTLYFMVGLAYYQNQEYKKAIPLFEYVIEIQNYNYKVHEKLAECYHKIGNQQKATYHENIMKELLAL